MSLVAGFVRIFAKNWWLGLIVLVLLLVMPVMLLLFPAGAGSGSAAGNSAAW